MDFLGEKDGAGPGAAGVAATSAFPVGGLPEALGVGAGNAGRSGAGGGETAGAGLTWGGSGALGGDAVVGGDDGADDGARERPGGGTVTLICIAGVGGGWLA